MRTPELDQVVVSPEDSTPSLILEIKGLIEAEEPPRLTGRLKRRIALGRLIHPLGIHHWVRWRHYDQGSTRLIEMGWTCMNCNVGRSR